MREGGGVACQGSPRRSVVSLPLPRTGPCLRKRPRRACAACPEEMRRCGAPSAPSASAPGDTCDHRVEARLPLADVSRSCGRVSGCTISAAAAPASSRRGSASVRWQRRGQRRVLLARARRCDGMEERQVGGVCARRGRNADAGAARQPVGGGRMRRRRRRRRLAAVPTARRVRIDARARAAPGSHRLPAAHVDRHADRCASPRGWARATLVRTGDWRGACTTSRAPGVAASQGGRER